MSRNLQVSKSSMRVSSLIWMLIAEQRLHYVYGLKWYEIDAFIGENLFPMCSGPSEWASEQTNKRSARAKRAVQSKQKNEWYKRTCEWPSTLTRRFQTTWFFPMWIECMVEEVWKWLNNTEPMKDKLRRNMYHSIGWFLKRFHLAFLVSSRFRREKTILLWKAKIKSYLWANFHDIWQWSKTSKLDI